MRAQDVEQVGRLLRSEFRIYSKLDREPNPRTPQMGATAVEIPAVP